MTRFFAGLSSSSASRLDPTAPRAKWYRPARVLIRILALALALMTTSMLLPPAATAEADPAPAIKAAVEAWLKGRYKVDEVRKTPLGGMYEVRIGADLVYVDEKAQYVFVEGNLIDMKASRNLTKERTDELMTINFKDLPLALAIKQVNGNGKRVVAVFEDPNCGYCKTMRKDLIALKDATIYTFTLPILAADSEVKARKAMCAPDKLKAWNDLMLNGKVPDNAGTCENPVAKVRELAGKLNISATPTLFFVTGKRLQGYTPPEQFEKLLQENSKG